ncbi:Crp/Fnr family transcriptional regulator [Devosia sp.]|uniref:Crp/Fnr family transcriptional regulator n=1 Tax=Devosia sp. TaxID=1871048 RepID=UPI0035B36FFE
MTVKALNEVEIPQVCRSCSARHDGMCAALTTAELGLLATHTRHTHHRPGEALTIESDEITSYANVTDGVVKLSRVLRDGRQQLVGLQFAPDLMGRLFGTESPITAEAASEVALCRVPKLVLEMLVEGSDELKRRLLDQSLQDLDDAREWMVTLGRKTAAERVASLFLLVASRTGDGGGKVAGPVSFELPLGRGDMADFLGLTIETVSRQISKLRNEGLVSIENHRHVTVPDLAALRRRAG